MLTVEKKTAEAAWPRSPGSSTFVADKLRVVYNKYASKSDTITDTAGKTVVNLIFSHGTGMNKSVWEVHIKELFRRFETAQNFVLGKVLSIDGATHGDSALLNKDLLGWSCDFRDGGKDICKVVTHEIETTGDFTPSPTCRNILVGHSLGGYHSSHAACLEPTLFDSCIAIEPVLYVEPQFFPFFHKKMMKLNRILVEQFDNMDQVNEYFRKTSFYKGLDPLVLDDFIADEIYEENGKFRTKASIKAQMASYLSSFFSLEPGKHIMKMIQIPYLHVVGSTAAWNLPTTVDFVKESVPANLYKFREMEGTHLLHIENVTGTIDVIEEYIRERVDSVRGHIDEFPEVKFNNNRQLINTEMYKHVLAGDIDEAFCYGKPPRKRDLNL